MATEEQLVCTASSNFLANRTRHGQRLTIPARTVSHLGFWLQRTGTITGDLVLAIRQLDGTLLVSKLWGNVSAVPTGKTYIEVEFDAALLVDEEARITAEWDTATYSASNKLVFWAENSPQKADEVYTWFDPPDWIEPFADWDAGYIYTYEDAAPEGPSASMGAKMMAAGCI